MGGMAKKAPMLEPSPTNSLVIDQTDDLPEPLSTDPSLNLDNLALIEPMDPLVSEQGSLQVQGTDLFKSKDSGQQNETDDNIPALIQPIDRVVSNKELLQASLPNTTQEKTAAKQQKHQVLSDKKPSFPRRSRLSDQKHLKDSQQEAKHNRRTNASSQVLEEATKTTGQLAPASQDISSVVTSEPESKKESKTFTAKGGHQVRFQQQASGQWVAEVEENLPVGISRRLALPVYLEPGQSIATVCEHNAAWQKNNIHVVFHKPKSYVFVGVMGLLGGMMEDGADGKSRREGKEEALATNNNTLPAPTDLSGKLKYLYSQDDNLPKLIEADDISEQKIKDYYVKLQVVLQEDTEKAKSGAAQDKVPGQKKAIAIEKFFDEIDKEHPAVGKVLLLGGAGIGKTTLMHYISYQWANGKLWTDKYEHVFRVRLKELLNSKWDNQVDEDDLLARFIYSSLDGQKTTLRVKGNKEVGKIKYKLSEIQQLLEDPSKQEKVLLLVDGYDEIAGLKGTTKYQKILNLGVFEHPNVIMTSRPNAASTDIRKEFKRQIESQGLDESGIHAYIDLQFKQPGKKDQELGKDLKAFLSSNSQVKGMCQVPINMALLCIIWKDPETRTKLTQSMELKTRKDFKLGQLYHELIVWLGKRYILRKNEAYKNDPSSPKGIHDLSDEAILEEKVFKALEQIAYESFTGQGLIESEHTGVLAIPGKIIDRIGRKANSPVTVEEVNSYGLLKGEGDPNKPLEQLYYFIHLTFQEYLTAFHLKELLSQKDKEQVQAVATWIAHHRNEPKYLMTLKFLAGLVSQSKDKLLVQRFWESVSCNVEGILELGLESKVSLLIHLLGQSSIAGKLDERIPNLAQIQVLIDEVVVGDIGKWQPTVIESGYLSPKLIEVVSSMMDGADVFKLKVATEIVAGMASKGVFGSREKIYGQLMRLASFPDWQIQKLGLQKAATVLDQTISEPTLKESIQMLMPLLRDANLKGSALYVLAKLAKIKSELVYDHLQAVSSEVKKVVTSELSEIIQVAPKEEFATLLNLVTQLLDDQNSNVRSRAASALSAIIKGAPKEKFTSLLNLVKPLLGDQNWDVRSGTASALSAIIKVVPKEKFTPLLNLFKLLLAGQNTYVGYSEMQALSEISKIVPKEESPTLLSLVKPLLTDQSGGVRSSAADILREFIQGLQWSTELVDLLMDENPQIRDAAREGLITQFKIQEQLAKLDYTQVKLLLRIIELNQGSNELEQRIQAGANQALLQIAEHIPGEGIKWLNGNVAVLPDTPALRTFLKAVLHQALSDGIIDDVEAQLFIKCILEKGITATIDLKGNTFILEDSRYPLKLASQPNLMHIANKVIKRSQDRLAQQYRTHKPLFVNTGSALPIATADIQRVGSVVDDTKLDSEHWHLSVMHLSNHHKNTPKEVFLLLEQRSYAGEHVIHQITLDKSKFKVESYALTPLEVGKKREALFGKMTYINTKLRYYGSSFTLSQGLGEKLLPACNNQGNSNSNSQPAMADPYKVLHELAARYVDLLQNSNNQSSLLSLSWPDYVKQPKVVEYRKDKLLQVDAEQVRKDSRVIESQELVRVQSKQIGKHEKKIAKHTDQLYKQDVAIEDHEQQLDNLKGKMQLQEWEIKKREIEAVDQEQRLDNLHSRVENQEGQLQKQEMEVENQAQKMEILDFRTKNQEEQPQKHGKEPQDDEKQINTPNKTLEIGSIKEEGIIAQSAIVKGIDLKLVAGSFDSKTLQKLKEQASKGLWKKTMQRPGKEKECEEYFEEKYVAGCLKAASRKNTKLVMSKETILAARIVLFEAMNKGIVSSKEPSKVVLQCADEFGKAYPELTKQIAKGYPEYFMDIAIAEHCIKDATLLAEVKSKLPAKSRW
jgi:hypothetical protein